MTNKKLYVLFVAGGSGVRMGTEVPKQFLDLAGKPILQQTILRFIYAHPAIVPVVVLPQEHLATWKRLCAETHFDLPQVLVAGGITRFHSVLAGLEKVPDSALVCIHDGVRPLASEALIKRAIAEAEKEGSAVPVVAIADTLKSAVRGQDGKIVALEDADPDRSRIAAAQTPQIFSAGLLKKAYSRGYSTEFTDDASVMRAAGLPVHYFEGEKYNLKITTPEDLALAQILFSN